MKHFSTKMMLFVLMSMMGANAYAQDITVENSQGVKLSYYYTKDGKDLILARCASDPKNVIIPEEVTYMNRTRKVTSIGDGAFQSQSYLTSVTIPNTVTSIGINAFQDCRRLTSVTIPEGVTSIGMRAFASSGLTSITIPNSVTTIGAHAFQSCNELTSVTLPSNVTSMGTGAFQFCNKLTSISIPGSLAIIEPGTFMSCSSLASVTISNGVKIIKETAFEGCSSLTSITIPNSVLSIGMMTFEGCTSLASITIGSGLIGIQERAFRDCESLSAVHISDIAAWCKVVFKGGYSNPLGIAHHLYMNGNEVKDLVIPEGVTVIKNSVFYYLANLNSLTLPKSLSKIENYAFKGCDITTVNAMMDNPTGITKKADSSSPFSLNTFNNATLNVPAGAIEKYKATEGWKDFVFIEEKK